MGFDVALFLKNPDTSLRCTFCLGVFEKPVTPCVEGHTFCKECVATLIRAGGARTKTCPTCQKPINATQKNWTRALFVEQIVGKLEIQCGLGYISNPRKKARNAKLVACCPWVGKVEDRAAHRDDDCDFQEIPCPHCARSFPRRDHKQHVSSECDALPVKCEHCNAQMEKRALKAHERSCPQKPVKCPKNCGSLIAREDLAEHLESDCPKQQIACPYAKAGCTKRCIRENMPKHLSDELSSHAELSTSKIASLEDRLAALEQTMNTRVAALETKAAETNSHTLVFKIPKFLQKAQEKNTLWSAISTDISGHKFQIYIPFNGEDVGIFLKVTEAQLYPVRLAGSTFTIISHSSARSISLKFNDKSLIEDCGKNRGWHSFTKIGILKTGYISASGQLIVEVTIKLKPHRSENIALLV